jgi:hypothetical protein
MKVFCQTLKSPLPWLSRGTKEVRKGYKFFHHGPLDWYKRTNKKLVVKSSNLVNSRAQHEVMVVRVRVGNSHSKKKSSSLHGDTTTLTQFLHNC